MASLAMPPGGGLSCWWPGREEAGLPSCFSEEYSGARSRPQT